MFVSNMGFFPERWKMANLILIPKEPFVNDNPKARPICLIINTIAKIFFLRF